MSRKRATSSNADLDTNSTTSDSVATPEPIKQRRTKDSLQVWLQQVTKTKVTIVFTIAGIVVNWYYLDTALSDAEMAFYNAFDAKTLQHSIKSRISPFKLVMELDTSNNGMILERDDETNFTELTLSLVNILISWFKGMKYLNTQIKDIRDKKVVLSEQETDLEKDDNTDDIPF